MEDNEHVDDPLMARLLEYARVNDGVRKRGLVLGEAEIRMAMAGLAG